VGVIGTVSVSPVSPSAKLLLTQKSSKLVDVLKVLLCYSNNLWPNASAKLLAARSVQRQLITTLGIPTSASKNIFIKRPRKESFTPAVMMKILRALRDELKKNKLSPSELNAVAGIDSRHNAGSIHRPGVARKRHRKDRHTARTDGGASSLVGQLKAANGEILLFVIMNQSGSVWSLGRTRIFW